MICPKCHADNLPDSQFCAHCGTKLNSELDKTITFAAPVEIAEEAQIDFERLADEGPLLVVVKGIGVGTTFSLEGKETLIGRDPGNHIFLDDITVSRKHAKIWRDEEDLLLADTGSLNGTYVNKERVDEVRLSNRDEIQIGKFKMIFLDKASEARSDSDKG